MVGSDSQEKLLHELNIKVKEVYRKCLGDSEGSLSTLQMLTSIENKLESLFETIEMMPPDKVEQAEKVKDKERRQRIREEKMEAQKILQEERVQRALERAKAPVKKKVIDMHDSYARLESQWSSDQPRHKRKSKKPKTQRKRKRVIISTFFIYIEDLEYYWQ
jgi:hypothetical protein